MPEQPASIGENRLREVRKQEIVLHIYHYHRRFGRIDLIDLHYLGSPQRLRTTGTGSTGHDADPILPTGREKTCRHA
jgi:hypothetical protein